VEVKTVELLDWSPFSSFMGFTSSTLATDEFITPGLFWVGWVA
jgi:hypothetical protein